LTGRRAIRDQDTRAAQGRHAIYARAVKLFGKKVGPEVDVFELNVRDDGIAEDPCWFCGGAVIVPKEGPVGDAAIIMIDPLGGEGAKMHGVCHATCAELARGSLRL